MAKREEWSKEAGAGSRGGIKKVETKDIASNHVWFASSFELTRFRFALLWKQCALIGQ